MAPANAGQQVFELPLSGNVSVLLELEGVIQDLEEARQLNIPPYRRLAAERLAQQLPNLASDSLERTLIQEIRRWTRFLYELSERPGADAVKVHRLRSDLERLADRLGQEWEGYFRALSKDPWMAALGASNSEERRLPSGSAAWTSSRGSQERFDRWLHLLGPIRTANEAILRLLRDSLQRKDVCVPPEGYALGLATTPAAGLLEVQAPWDSFLPVFKPGRAGGRIFFRSQNELGAAPEPVDAVVGWFTL